VTPATNPQFAVVVSGFPVETLATYEVPTGFESLRGSVGSVSILRLSASLARLGRIEL